MKEDENPKVMVAPNLIMPRELQPSMYDTADDYPNQLCFVIKNIGVSVWVDDMKASRGEIVSKTKFYLTDDAMIRIMDSDIEDDKPLQVDIYVHAVDGNKYHYVIEYTDNNNYEILNGEPIK